MSDSENMIKCLLVMLCFIYTGSSNEIQPGGLNEYKNSTENRGLNDDEWIWGYVDVTERTVTPPYDISEALIDNEQPENPCALYNPPKPNFSAPGRRISETKCLEYIWEFKVRDEITNRSSACKTYLNEHPDSEFIPPLGVIGGEQTKPGEYPHMGAIGWLAPSGSWIFKCGGSLISPKFVLTAAHCSRGSERDTSIADPVPKIVRLGDKNIIDMDLNGLLPTDAKIINIIVHPSYSPPKKYDDIALMELDYDVAFTNFIQPGCLWNSFDTSSLGTEATLTGWGVIDTLGQTVSPELLYGTVDIVDPAKCQQLLMHNCNRNWCGVKDTQLCAGKAVGGVDACQGDSGGPLQVKMPLPITSEGQMHFIIGVTSFGIGCALPNLPGIYTRVSSYLDWIEPIVWRN